MGLFHIPLMVLLDPPVVCTHYHIILRLLQTYLVNLMLLHCPVAIANYSAVSKYSLLVSVMTLVGICSHGGIRNRRSPAVCGTSPLNVYCYVFIGLD